MGPPAMGLSRMGRGERLGGIGAGTSSKGMNREEYRLRKKVKVMVEHKIKIKSKCTIYFFFMTKFICAQARIQCAQLSRVQHIHS